MKKKLYLVFTCLMGTLSIPAQSVSPNEGKIPLAADQWQSQKPKVWIYSDMTDKTLPGQNHMGTINDPDDISAMAAYLLMANMFDTKGIVIGSTHREQHKDTPDQAEWANLFFGAAYKKDLVKLNKHIGGYPEEMHLYLPKESLFMIVWIIQMRQLIGYY